MNDQLVDVILQLNPWLSASGMEVAVEKNTIPRQYINFLLSADWDSLCTVLVGPRQAGKTTLGMQLCQQLVAQKRFSHLLYLNCDLLQIREWLDSPLFIQAACEQFSLKKPIIFIDEVQRLASPGLLLKAIIDLKLPIKLVASGSSQLEFKSKVQEHLTGRQVESLILPLSIEEYAVGESEMIYGCYPGIVLAEQKAVLLEELYRQYIKKDIVEILRVGKPDVMEKLIVLLAQSAGQLVNYSQLAADCKVSVPTVQQYLDVLENTYVIKKIKPFVGNKRKEVTTNPIYYFIDNGFRNQALQNFQPLEQRQDNGLLVENMVFQTLFKHQAQHRRNLNIHYWRTQSGAEVDFVLASPSQSVLPIEVKYRNMKAPTLTRGFHSFIDAYQPEKAVVITKNFSKVIQSNGCEVHFLSLREMKQLGALL